MSSITNKMKFTKTEAEYNMKSLRFLLLTITTMFIMIAGLMIVLGYSVYTQFHDFSYFYSSAKNGRLFTPSILCIVLGMFLLIVTMFGFFGSIKQSTCMVNLYAFIISILFLLKLIVVILAFTLDSSKLYKYINLPLAYYGKDPEIAAEVDRIQLSLDCCGGESYLDYVDAEYTENQPTVVVSSHINGSHLSVVLPMSCCSKENEILCTQIRKTGCKAAIVNVIVQNSGVIAILGVSVMFIELLGIVFALLLARSIRKMKSEKILTSWKLKEEMILARKEANLGCDDRVYIAASDSSTA